MKTPSERNELVGFIHRHDFAPTISQRGIAKAFDNRGRELEENYNPNVIIEALRHDENDKVVPITLGQLSAKRLGFRHVVPVLLIDL